MTYDIHLDVKFDPLTHIDLDAEAAAVKPWFNQTLTQVNDCVVRLEQREAHLAHRGVDVVLAQLAARANVAESGLEAVGERVEHR